MGPLLNGPFLRISLYWLWLSQFWKLRDWRGECLLGGVLHEDVVLMWRNTTFRSHGRNATLQLVVKAIVVVFWIMYSKLIPYFMCSKEIWNWLNLLLPAAQKFYEWRLAAKAYKQALDFFCCVVWHHSYASLLALSVWEEELFTVAKCLQ